MASPRYTINIKPEDLLPDQPRQLSPKEKLLNWWHYSWKWVVLGLIGLGLVGMFIKDIVTQVKPDYNLLWVAERGLPDDVNTSLCNAFASLGSDLNGDGEVVVNLTVCQIRLPKAPPASGSEGQPSSEVATEEEANQMGDPYTQMAAVTFLTTDLQTGESLIVLTDDPEGLQRNYEMLAGPSGEAPTQPGSLEGVALYAWQDCPVAAGFELGSYSDALGQGSYDSSALLDGIYITRRSFEPGRGMKQYQAENEAMFAALTAGATPARLK